MKKEHEESCSLLSKDESPSKLVANLVGILILLVGACLFGFLIYLGIEESKKPAPAIQLASMDFTVLNITQTRLSAKWDLSIRIPSGLPGRYICLQGDLQASLLYKNLTLATSSPQKYYGLRYRQPQVLKVSAEVSGEDIGGLIGENIMKDVKEKKEVQFGSQFSLTDCRKESNGVMSYVCDEVNLQFEPGSETKATVFGNLHPSCINV